MERYLGTWQLVKIQGLEGFLRAIGLPNEVVEILARKLVYTLEYKRNGEKFSFLLKTSVPENSADRRGDFKLGQTVETEGPFGSSTVSITTTMKGEKMVEEFQQKEMDKKWTQVKEINGDTMVAKSTYNDKVLVQTFKKISK